MFTYNKRFTYYSTFIQIPFVSNHLKLPTCFEGDFWFCRCFSCAFIQWIDFICMSCVDKHFLQNFYPSFNMLRFLMPLLGVIFSSLSTWNYSGPFPAFLILKPLTFLSALLPASHVFTFDFDCIKLQKGCFSFSLQMGRGSGAEKGVRFGKPLLILAWKPAFRKFWSSSTPRNILNLN